MKTSTKNVLIGAIATIIGAALGAGAMHTYTTYTNSNENDNKNNNSVEINIDGKAVDMTTDEYKEFADKITEENEKLQEEVEQLKKDLAENKKEQEASISKEQNEEEAKEEGENGVSLLSATKTINPCSGYEEVKVGTMSLRGENYSNGFILEPYGRGDTDGVEFKLGKKYQIMSFDIGHLDESSKEGVFTLTYSLDGEVQQEISIEPENSVQHVEIELKNADIIKFNWSNTQGSAEYGVANVMVYE